MILMLSMHSEVTLVRQALDAGARGYILKDALDLDLAAAVKRAVAGENRCSTRSSPRLGTQRGAGPRLSPRELEVLRLICDGLSNRAIAAKLGLSVNTIAVHRANIMKALGRAQDRRTGDVRDPERAGERSVNRREFLRDVCAAACVVSGSDPGASLFRHRGKPRRLGDAAG